jgi:hypothetical protein
VAASRKIGPYSRPGALAQIDGRTKESGLLRHVRATLAKHVGGNPSAVQSALIERIAWLSLHVAQLDAKMVESGKYTMHDSNQYLAYSNSLARALAALGLKGATEAPQTLAQLIAASRPAAES